MACCTPQIVVGDGGGGPSTVATTDTPTVDLSGDGSAATPLSAAVRLAPAPNAITQTADGLLVTPPENVEVVGSLGPSPVPVGSGRSVDISVTEAPAGTFTVTGRISPKWGEVIGLASEAAGPLTAGQTRPFGPFDTPVEFLVPEDGIYALDLDANFQLNVDVPAASSSYNGIGFVGMARNDASIGSATAVGFTGTSDYDFGRIGHAHVSRALQLVQGDVIAAWWGMTVTLATMTGNVFPPTLRWHKIAD